MVSSEYERRIAARFATFDQDGNGYIDREDFSAAAKALLAEFGTPARSDKGQALYIGAEAFVLAGHGRDRRPRRRPAHHP